MNKLNCKRDDSFTRHIPNSVYTVKICGNLRDKEKDR